MRNPSTPVDSPKDSGVLTPTEIVAGAIQSVVKVATNVENVNTVAASDAVIKEVATNITAIVDVASLKQAISMLTPSLSNIEEVAANLGVVNNVSNHMATLLLLHGKMQLLLDIEASLDGLNTIALNMANLESVREAIPEITTVVSHMGDIHFLAQNGEVLNQLFANLDALITLANSLDAVNTLNENMDVIIAASTYVEQIEQNLQKIEIIEQHVIALAEQTASNKEAVDNAKVSIEQTATQVSQLATTATSAKNAAEIAANTATVKANTAAVKADEARDSAQSASLSAGQAGNAVTQASTYANTARTYRDSAQGYANNASDSATSASQSLQSTNAARDATLASENRVSVMEESVATMQDTVTTKTQEAIQAANTATSEATKAGQSANTAATQAGIATDKASEAKGYRDEFFGLATETPTGNKVPIANSQGKIHAGWLPANASALSEAVVEAIRDGRKEQYAASGFINYGIGHTTNNINEGMWSNPITSDVLYMGKSGVPSGHIGESETDYAVMNIAGFISNIRNINYPLGVLSRFLLPQAPKGYDVYDSSGSCRGSGKPTLNLRTEIDPKYGDIASTDNEAVARAFEGVVKNADLRHGLDFWVPGSGATLSNIGNRVVGILSDSRWATGRPAHTLIAGVKYEISFDLLDTGDVIGAGISAYNGISDLHPSTGSAGTYYYPYKAGSYVCTFTATEGGYIRLIADTASKSAHFRLNYIRPVTEEVVTERVDLVGLEFFKEKVGAYLYPYGMIQNKLTTVDGVPTTEDTIRPITYFAAFDGDTTSLGRGWKLADLTFVQLATIMSNPEHNAWYNEAGELIQFRCRQRSIAGAGNGDWVNVNPAGTNSAYIGFDNYNRVRVQGRLDNAAPYSNTATSSFNTGINIKDHANPNTGVGLAGNKYESYSVDGECYFYVLATVPRLNQGAFHPSFNPMGAASWRDSVDYNTARKWHETKVNVTSSAMCFDIGTSPSQVAGGNINNSTKWAGRPDGRFYDVIYPDGLGGVIDWRLPARDMSGFEEAAKVFLKVVNGTYRGLQKLPQVVPILEFKASSDTVSSGYIPCDVNTIRYLQPKMMKTAPTSSTQNFTDDIISELKGFGYKFTDAVNASQMITPYGVILYNKTQGKSVAYDSGASHAIYRTDTKLTTYPLNISKIVTSQPETRLDYWVNAHVAAGDEIVIYGCVPTNISVSGDFTMTDVIGSPVNIFTTPQLKNGWLGGWIPQLPTGTSVNFTFTRKKIGDTWSRTFTSDYGASWTVQQNPSFNGVTNSSATSFVVNGVMLCQYTAFAKQTKVSSNKPVFNGSAGLGDVWAAQRWRTENGVLLTESLIGKVATSGTNICVSSEKLTGYTLDEFEKLTNQVNVTSPTHTPVKLSAPTENGPAVKALWHQASNNRQLNLNLVWNEMVWGTPTYTNKLESAGGFTKDVHYNITNGAWKGYYLCNLTVAEALTDLIRGADNNIYFSDGRRVLTFLGVTPGSWGDDSTVRVATALGVFNNLNGDACLYNIHELAMPYGYSKNQAGAGEQVVGVDL